MCIPSGAHFFFTLPYTITSLQLRQTTVHTDNIIRVGVSIRLKSVKTLLKSNRILGTIRSYGR